MSHHYSAKTPEEILATASEIFQPKTNAEFTGVSAAELDLDSGIRSRFFSWRDNAGVEGKERFVKSLQALEAWGKAEGNEIRFMSSLELGEGGLKIMYIKTNMIDNQSGEPIALAIRSVGEGSPVPIFHPHFWSGTETETVKIWHEDQPRKMSLWKMEKFGDRWLYSEDQDWALGNVYRLAIQNGYIRPSPAPERHAPVHTRTGVEHSKVA